MSTGPAFFQAVEKLQDVAALSVGRDTITVYYDDGTESRLEDADAQAFGALCVFCSPGESGRPS